MKKTILLCGLLTSLSAIGYANSGNLNGGVRNFREGNFVGAVTDLQPLSHKGDAGGQYYIGLMYLNGQGLPKDDAQAFQWFGKSAKQGYARAQNALGELYFYARGTPRNHEQAQFWFRKAANQNLAAGQRNLGYTYLALNPHDYQKGVFWLKKAARQGDEIDQLILANLYHSQREVQDDTKSAYWMRKAADQGVADAQNALGDCYLYGLGVPDNITQALTWYQKADSQGHIEAAYNIAQIYEQGKRVPRDSALASHWYCKAAKLDNENAIYNLSNGRVDCLADLANQGQVLAQAELGRWYAREIEPTPKNYPGYVTAAFWSRKAAEQGNGAALNRLGDLYAQGLGVPLEPVISQMLYIIARPKSSGGEHSSRIRETLSESQINEARALAKSWKEGTPLPERSVTWEIPHAIPAEP